MKTDNKNRTYSVQQIAELLDTNPETVRRWIRDKKLGAIQVSRKDGNIITEDEFQKFLKSAPKYMARLAATSTFISPVLSLAAFIGTLGAGALIKYQSEKDKDFRILEGDLKKYLNEAVIKMFDTISQKEVLIEQTQKDIHVLRNQIRHYQLLLNNEDMLKETIRIITDSSLTQES